MGLINMQPNSQGASQQPSFPQHPASTCWATTPSPSVCHNLPITYSTGASLVHFLDGCIGNRERRVEGNNKSQIFCWLQKLHPSDGLWNPDFHSHIQGDHYTQCVQLRRGPCEEPSFMPWGSTIAITSYLASELTGCFSNLSFTGCQSFGWIISHVSSRTFHVCLGSKTQTPLSVFKASQSVAPMCSLMILLKFPSSTLTCFCTLCDDLPFSTYLTP